MGAMDVPGDISKLCCTMDFLGARRLPTPSTVWALLPSGFLGGGGHGGPTRSPLPPRSGGRAGVRREETRRCSLHSWEQSATEVPRRALPVSDVSLSLRVSVPALPPHPPTPPATFQPPRENKSAPSPDAPLTSHEHALPSLPNSCPPLKATPNFPSALLASAQTARGQASRQPPLGSGARLWGGSPDAPVRGSGTPERSPPGLAARPEPTWPGHSAARSESALWSRPFASCEPRSRPPTGRRPPSSPGSAGS